MDVDFFQPAAKASRDYFLLVSALVPYKNISLVIEACRQLGEKLIIVGRGPEQKKLKKAAGPGSEFLPTVSAETLRELYRNARAFVFAGVEDFGIAFAECQACGTPVIALNRGGVRDIVKDGASGVLFGQPDVAALKQAIRAAGEMDFDPAVIREMSLRFSAARFRAQFQDFIGGTKR